MTVQLQCIVFVSLFIQSNGEEVSVFVFDVKSSSETLVSCPYLDISELYSRSVGPCDAVRWCLPLV